MGTAGLVLAAAGGSLTAVVVAVAATGLFVGPVMVTVFTVAGERAPAGRTASAMTLVASANVVGVAIGASGAARSPTPCRRRARSRSPSSRRSCSS